jgi:hypothetical protein
MTSVVPFTSNHSDVSTNEGYQYEFRCLRCGNGFRSRFRHSISGTGGRIAALAGGLIGGAWGARIEQFGLMAGWNRSSMRGSTNDENLLEASQDAADEFVQCRGCGQWLCKQVSGTTRPATAWGACRARRRRSPAGAVAAGTTATVRTAATAAARCG